MRSRRSITSASAARRWCWSAATTPRWRGVGDQLGIETTVGGYLPADKLNFVQQLRRGCVVAMVGDGINDAAVLGAADVSFAMGGGAALAQAHADAVLLNGRLSAVADSARVAARAMQVIRQNLCWASMYNVAAIPPPPSACSIRGCPASAWRSVPPWWC
jgi:P-type E1-E2 ATPase